MTEIDHENVVNFVVVILLRLFALYYFNYSYFRCDEFMKLTIDDVGDKVPILIMTVY